MSDLIHELSLGVWQEIAGKCIKIAQTEDEAMIILQTNNQKYSIRLPRTRRKLETLQGQQIAILKTDDVEKPFLIRKVSTFKTTPTNTEDRAMTVARTIPCEFQASKNC